MRILNIDAHYQDKFWYQDYYLGREWVNMGHEVHYIASDRHFKFPNYNTTVRDVLGDRYVGLTDFTNDFGAKVHRLKGGLEFTGRVWMYGLEQKIEEIGPDLIVCHGLLNLYSYRVALVAKRLNIKVIFDDHTTTNLVAVHSYAKLIRFVFRNTAAHLIQNVSSKIIGISDSVMIVLKEYFGFTDKLQMIPLGSDPTIFYPDKNLRESYRESLKIKPEDLLIVYTGKIYNLKRIDLIIDALNVVNSSQRIVILFVGAVANDYKEEFDQILKRSRWETKLIASMQSGELVKVYNAADIAAWPAHLTISTTDASACGCAVIINNLMPERITYNNGIGINNNNLQEVIDAFELLINDSQLRHEMGIRGIALVQNELSWKAIAAKFLEGI